MQSKTYEYLFNLKVYNVYKYFELLFKGADTYLLRYRRGQTFSVSISEA